MSGNIARQDRQKCLSYSSISSPFPPFTTRTRGALITRGTTTLISGVIGRSMRGI
jgi:hypothetical protein